MGSMQYKEKMYVNENVFSTTQQTNAEILAANLFFHVTEQRLLA